MTDTTTTAESTSREGEEEFAHETKKDLGVLFRVSWRTVQLLSRIVPGAMIATVVLALVSSVTGLLLAWGNGHLIDTIARVPGGGVTPGALLSSVALVLGLFALPDVVGLLREAAERTLWLRGISQMEVQFSRARYSIDVASSEQPAFVDRYEKALDRGVHSFGNLFENQVASLQDLVTALVAVLVLLPYGPLLIGLVILGSLPSLFVEARFGRLVWGLWDINAEARRRFYFLRSFADRIERRMELHLLSLTDRLIGKMDFLARSFAALQIEKVYRKLWWRALATVFSLGLSSAVVYLVIEKVVRGEITPGQFIFLFSAIVAFSSSVSRLFLGFGHQYEFALYARDILDIMDVTPALLRAKDPQPALLDPAPEIVFDDVSFRYPGQSHDVLSHVSFTIPAGTSFALVGINGAGKTTLVKLLARFYDPTGGRILVGGVDLRSLDLAEWYQHLAVLFQHFPAYEGFTVRDGIAMGNVILPVHQEAVQRAAVAADADVFITAWDQGYDQMIGKQFSGGLDPSRGQEQRIALARMFYRGAGCLILDEPTAAVDAESEEHIFRAIEGMEGKTRLLISHRFSTVRNAQQICVLDGGSIREIGTHAELLAKDGEYARLFRMQAAGYKEEEGGEDGSKGE